MKEVINNSYESQLKSLVNLNANKDIFYYNKKTMNEIFFKSSQIGDINLKYFLLVVLMNLDLETLNQSKIHTNMYKQISKYGDVIKFEEGALIQAGDYKWHSGKRIIFSPNKSLNTFLAIKYLSSHQNNKKDKSEYDKWKKNAKNEAYSSTETYEIHNIANALLGIEIGKKLEG